MSEVPTTWSVTRQIVRESGIGLNGLNKGLSATIGRNGIFNMIYFGFYHSVKGIVPEYKVSKNILKVLVIVMNCGEYENTIHILHSVFLSNCQQNNTRLFLYRVNMCNFGLSILSISFVILAHFICICQSILTLVISLYFILQTTN